MFHEVFSSRELLEFGARLRVCGPESHRKSVVDRIISDLELKQVEKISLQNYSAKKIPNIEKRKITVALELLDDPAIIFIDDIIGGSESGGISSDRAGQFKLLSVVKQEAR